MAAAPGLNVLVTSRTVLHLSGEREYAVPPLALPDRLHLPPLEGLTQYEAVRLFIDRAQAVKADFAVTNENAGAGRDLLPTRWAAIGDRAGGRAQQAVRTRGAAGPLE